ncbi:hypothetical protein BDN72DRAFT_959546 [Pluteus cervinus]|uniref:Uncharacterized protein n=1 Tax=Pluteus cervinus TaxID=181527 RepID=A0ACD3AUV8_9AGAR|nr:hypothetical protein BDN72DRAFT_959546 [Pluteus cervinus]
MPDLLEPFFPPEIEEIIFSLCIQSDLWKSRHLILVAKRVYQWLRPQLYELALFYGGNIPRRPRFRSKLLKMHGQYVRHLLIWESFDFDSVECGLDDSPGKCFSWCPNVVSIALWGIKMRYDRTLVDQLIRLSTSLTHLSFDVSLFDSRLKGYSISTKVSFPSVTHLELTGYPIRLNWDDIRKYFPSLTHLALRAHIGLLAQLDDCGDQLELLIWYSDALLDPSTQPKDPRIVVMSGPQRYDIVNDWVDGAKDVPSSIWRRIEQQVTSRR